MRLTVRCLFYVCIFSAPLVLAQEESILSLSHPAPPHILQIESSHIDFTHPDSYALLGEGWLQDSGELSPFGQQPAIACPSIRAVLHPIVVRPRPLRLQLSLRQRPVAGFPPQQVAIVWNDTRIGVCAFQESDRWSLRTFEFEVPADSQVSGKNKLTLLSYYAISPQELGLGNDPRRFAFGLDALHLVDPALESSENAAPAEVLFSQESIVQPGLSRLSLPLAVSGLKDARFSVRLAEIPGNGPRILVRHDKMDGAAVHTETLEAPGNLEIPLPPHASHVEIVLENTDEAPIQWHQPGIVAAGNPKATEDKAPSELPRVKNVVLVVLDALRGDHLGFRGYERDTTPFLDTVAEESTVFENAVSASPYTYSSTWSLLTGHFPIAHKAYALPLIPHPELPRLHEVLKDAGIRTGVVAANPYVSAETMMIEGFDVYLSGRENLQAARLIKDPERRRAEMAGEPELVTRLAAEFLEESGDTPFLLYLHYRQPHTPYYPTPEFTDLFSLDPAPHIKPDGSTVRAINRNKIGVGREDIEQFKARYDEVIRVADAEMAKLWDLLEELGLSDDTALLLTSDHGEAFGEHGQLTHSTTTYHEEVHIPMMLWTPGAPLGERFSHPVSTVDVFPTICRLLGVEVPEPLAHRGLFRTTFQPGAVEAAAFSNPKLGWEAYLFRRYKLVRNTQQQLVELYDRREDPEEMHNLAPVRPVRTKYYLAQALQWREAQLASTPEPSDGSSNELTEDTKAELEALGYLN